MPYLLRVELPDVPGSLGRVASAIGEAGGDIDAIEIVEKRDGFAVDDVLLEMAPGVMPDSVVSACSVLDGVSVLWINRYAAGGNLFLDLEVVEVGGHGLPQGPLVALGCSEGLRCGRQAGGCRGSTADHDPGGGAR